MGQGDASLQPDGRGKGKKFRSGVGADRLMGMIGCPSDVILRHPARAQIESQVSSLRQCPEQSMVLIASFSLISLAAIAILAEALL